MLCIDNPHTDAYFNLAAEEFLLKDFSNDIFMLWQNEPSVVIGKHQKIEAEVNLDFIRENQIKVVRRSSGGGTVFQDAGNLNLTFIETNDHPDFDKYTKQMLVFLSTVGISAKADERRALYINGLKISGSAQYLRRNKILYHATLLFSSNLLHLSATLDSQYRDAENGQSSQDWPYVKSVKSPVTNLREHLPYPITIKDFKKLIIKHFLGNNRENSPYAFSKEDIAAITRLKQEKYAPTSWNFPT